MSTRSLPSDRRCSTTAQTLRGTSPASKSRSNLRAGPSPHVIKEVREFRTVQPWGARDLALIEGATVRLHWTDGPYVWHVNDGTEVFAVLDGTVDMHFRCDGAEHVVTLGPSDIFVAHEGVEHVARPRGEARILVIEKAGSK